MWPSLTTHLTQQMTPRGVRNIHTTRKSCRDALPCMNMAPKTTPVFLPTDGEASCLLLPSSVSLLWGATMQLQNTYSHILKVTGQVWESQKRTRINTSHSYQQHSSPKASLNWSNNDARFSFNQPKRKRWGAKLVDIKHLPHKPFLSWHHH